MIFNNQIIALGVVIGLAILSSCASPKHTTVLNNPTAESYYTDTLRGQFDLNYDPYLIQEGDVLDIQIIGRFPDDYDLFSQKSEKEGNGERLVRGYPVRKNGLVSVPLIGKLKLSNKTVEEAEKTIQNSLDSAFSHAVATVSLLSFKVTLLGEFNKPGEQVITRTRSNVLEAIGRAGGLSEFGDASRIRLVRQYEPNKAKVIYLDLSKQNTLNNPNLYLRPNDVLVALPVRAKYFKPLTELSTYLSALSISVLIISRLLTI